MGRGTRTWHCLSRTGGPGSSDWHFHHVFLVLRISEPRVFTCPGTAKGDYSPDATPNLAATHGKERRRTRPGKELGLVYVYIYTYIYIYIYICIYIYIYIYCALDGRPQFLSCFSARLRSAALGAFLASSARSAPFFCRSHQGDGEPGQGDGPGRADWALPLAN